MSPETCPDHGCDRPARTRGLCEAHYRRLLTRGTPDWDKPIRRAPRPTGDFDVVRDVLDHLIEDTAGCLVWPHAQFRDGRGKVTTDTAHGQQVHVVVFVHFRGPVPDGLQVNHSCGRGHLACADIRHLYAGTQTQNLADAKRHGVRVGRPPKQH